MRTLICKIPPNLPFPKGGTIPLFGKAPFYSPSLEKLSFISPLWKRGARGDFFIMSIQSETFKISR